MNDAEQEAAEEEERDPGLLVSITLHECRHTFASMLIHAAVNPKAIQEFMGHSTIEMTFDQYGHLMPGSREQARELVDAYLEAASAEARVEAAAADLACASDVPVDSVTGSLAASGDPVERDGIPQPHAHGVAGGR